MNYPDPVQVDDEHAPWNRGTVKEPKRWFLFDPAIVSLAVEATSREEAIERLNCLIADDIEFDIVIDEIQEL